jgi:hypothetical protein
MKVWQGFHVEKSGYTCLAAAVALTTSADSLVKKTEVFLPVLQ